MFSHCRLMQQLIKCKRRQFAFDNWLCYHDLTNETLMSTHCAFELPSGHFSSAEFDSDPCVTPFQVQASDVLYSLVENIITITLNTGYGSITYNK